MVRKNNQSKKLFFIFSIISLISILLLVNFTMENNIDNSIVVVETNMGQFEIELYEDLMPITAGNFKKLVEQGFYKNQRFHRIIEGFMIQGGDPNSKEVSMKNLWGTGGPGYSIEDEFVEDYKLSNKKFTLSMANSGPNSGGSQFFINVANNVYLDFDKEPFSSKHPVFGKVVEGEDTILKISQVGTDSYDRPIEDIIIQNIYIKK